MLKADLEAKLARTEKELSTLKKKVDEGLKSVLDSNCESAIEPVESFCDIVGIKYPTSKITVEIPYGREIRSIEDDDYNDLTFEVLKTES